MTKDKNVYETKMIVAPDPRSNYTAEDRRAQFDLSMKLYRLLGDMTFAVDRINGVRLRSRNRRQAARGRPLAAQLRAASTQADALRKKIVATTEGGAITGEERLREYLTELYDSVIYYEGRPSQTQVMRTEAVAIADIVRDLTPGPRETSALNRPDS